MNLINALRSKYSKTLIFNVSYHGNKISLRNGITLLSGKHFGNRLQLREVTPDQDKTRSQNCTVGEMI